MPKLFALLFLLLTVPLPVFAEDNAPIQVKEIECQHIGELSEDEFSFLLAWLDGYFNHMHGTAVLSDRSLAALGTMIRDGCDESGVTALVLEILNTRIRQDALNQHP